VDAEKAAALALCLRFGVASKLASFVAVDYAPAAGGGKVAGSDMATRFVGQAELKSALTDSAPGVPEESLYVQMLRAEGQPIPAGMLQPQREQGRALPAAAPRRPGYGGRGARAGLEYQLDDIMGNVQGLGMMRMAGPASENSPDDDFELDVGMHAGHARMMDRGIARASAPPMASLGAMASARPAASAPPMASLGAMASARPAASAPPMASLGAMASARPAASAPPMASLGAMASARRGISVRARKSARPRAMKMKKGAGHRPVPTREAAVESRHQECSESLPIDDGGDGS